MKRLLCCSKVCEGVFFGGEIEPGVFHVHNIQHDKGSEEENVLGSNGEIARKEDKDKEQPGDSCSEKSSCD